jgi:predicted nucleic acid-binding protein
MSEKWVVNASPLIVLGKIGQINLLNSLAKEIVVPSAVAEEIKAGSENDSAKLAIETGNFNIVTTPSPNNELVAWDLGAGETSVLSFALENSGWTAIIDDRVARKCAISFNIPIKGSLAIVVLAKKRRVIPSAKSLLHAMQDAGLRLDDALIRKVLKETVNEDW